MSCSLSHTVEEIKEFVRKQCDIDDAARQEAIIAVSKLFNKEYHAKQALKEQYTECKDIPPEKRVVIQNFLKDESMKDLVVEHKFQRSKEDDVQKISTSVFVTNFSDLYGAKDLWNTCKTYGHVVDAYIPNRRSKAGKRFGFQRESLNKHSNQFNDNGTKKYNVGGRKKGDRAKGTANSYAHKVYSLCLLGKVKEFASLTNLKVVLAKEGYANIEIKYMGGFWVMIEFQDEESKKRFQSNLAADIWFSQISQAHKDFTIDERVTWVEIEGVPCKWWSRNTFSRIASRWGTLLNDNELKDGGFHMKRICICTDMKTILFESFKMVYRGKVCWVRAIEVLGWVPDFEDEIEEEYDSDDGSHEDEVNGGDLGNLKDLEGDSDVEEVPKSKFEEESNKHTLEENSVRQSNAQSKDPFGIYEALPKRLKKIGLKSYVCLISEAVGNSGGILCVWYPNMFQKMNETVLDYFTMVRGVCVPSGKSISSTSLDRYLSDHWPILMREIHYDYGPTPFKLFHYWFEIDGFDKLVEDSWKEAHVTDQNAYVKLMKKLRYLKEKIRMWRADVDVKRRQEVVSLLQEVEKVDSIEVAQKVKIKWAIEGDENSKYYHGVLNKNRVRLDIRGPLQNRIQLKRDFLNRITTDQNEDLEREVSKEDIERAVWDCGVDKAPGPDGFTFGFYRRQILDGPFILNELVQWWKKKKKQAMIFKVNFEKAYDSVRLDFVDDILKKFGFGEKWCLKWGNSLSPFLFILVMESLHVSFQRVVDAGLFKGIKVASSLYISHLFYADDAIFMGQLNQSNIDTITRSRVGGLMSWIQSWNDIIESMVSRNGVEQAQLELLKEKVEGCILSNMNDRWAWSLEGSGELLVSSVRKVIDATLLSKGTTKTRWIKAVPIKINVHAWKVKHDCISTRVNISRRGIKIESMLCPMCDNAVESSRHLFFSFRFISELMRKITRWWDMDYMEINSFEEWLEWVSSIRLPLEKKQIFEGMCYIL
nr:nucleotide-binding alpha-beta plait domain-containing protein [Tanacetum cinerariifolium]